MAEGPIYRSPCAPDDETPLSSWRDAWALQSQNISAWAPGGPEVDGGVEQIWAAEGSPVGWAPGSDAIPTRETPPVHLLPAAGSVDQVATYWYWQGALMTAVSRETIAADRYIPRVVAFPLATDTDGSGDQASGLLFDPGQTRRGSFAIQPGSLLIAASSFADTPPGGGGDCCSFRVSIEDAGAVTSLFAGSWASSKTQFGDPKATANPGQVIAEPTGPFMFPAPHAIARPGQVNWGITALTFDEPFYIQLALHFAVPLTAMNLGRPGDEAAEVKVSRYSGRQAVSIEEIYNSPFSGRAIQIGAAGHDQRIP